MVSCILHLHPVHLLHACTTRSFKQFPARAAAYDHTSVYIIYIHTCYIYFIYNYVYKMHTNYIAPCQSHLSEMSPEPEIPSPPHLQCFHHLHIISAHNIPRRRGRAQLPPGGHVAEMAQETLTGLGGFPGNSHGILFLRWGFPFRHRGSPSHHLF